MFDYSTVLFTMTHNDVITIFNTYTISPFRAYSSNIDGKVKITISNNLKISQ